MRDQIKLKIIEAFDNATKDETKYRGAVSEMVDLIINQAKEEMKDLIDERRKAIEVTDLGDGSKHIKDHRSHGIVRKPGDPK